VKYLIGADSFVGSGDFSKDFLVKDIWLWLNASRADRMASSRQAADCAVAPEMHRSSIRAPWLSVTSAETAISGLIGKLGHRLSEAATLNPVSQSTPHRPAHC